MFPGATQATGVDAIVRCLLLLAATVLSTFAISWVSYRAVELPMVGLGSRVCARLDLRK
jgi:peptidoglycan/LPS O-acetylase OafA/YrhL